MVVNILKEEGIDPGPKRGKGTWYDFIKRHKDPLWACDFLSVRSVTLTDCVDLFALFFIHIGTRHVIVPGVAANPDSAWVTQQARNASMEMDNLGLPAKILPLNVEFLSLEDDPKRGRLGAESLADDPNHGSAVALYCGDVARSVVTVPFAFVAVGWVECAVAFHFHVGK